MQIPFLINLWDPRIGSSARQMYQHAEGLRELGHETAATSTTADPTETAWCTVEEVQVYPTSNPATG
jgi:hypothetical protein